MNCSIVPNITRIMLPVILLIASCLMLFDCVPPFTNAQLSTCSNVDEGVTEPSSQEMERKCSNVYIQTIITFVVELSMTLTSVTTACLFLSLQSASNSTIQHDKSVKWKLPFPNRSDNDFRQASTVTYIKFAAFLFSVAGSFVGLMTVSVKAIQFGQSVVGWQLRRATDQSILYIQNCNLNQALGLINATLVLCLNLAMIINTVEWPSCSSLARQKSAPMTNLVELDCVVDKETSIERSKAIRERIAAKNIWSALRLNRLALSLASILITSGGLCILGCLLDLFQSKANQINLVLSIGQLMKLILGFTSGTLSCLVGFISVITIQCCSTPLDSLLSTSLDGKRRQLMVSTRFNRPAHLTTMILNLMLLPLVWAAYLTVRSHLAGQARMGNNLTQMGQSLTHVANFVGLFVGPTLLCSMVIDFHARMMCYADPQKAGQGLNKTNRLSPTSLNETYEHLENDDQGGLLHHASTSDSSNAAPPPLLVNKSSQVTRSLYERRELQKACSSPNVPEHKAHKDHAVFYNPSSPPKRKGVGKKLVLRQTPQPPMSDFYQYHHRPYHSQSIYSAPIHSRFDSQLIYACTGDNQPLDSNYASRPTQFILVPDARGAYMSCELPSQRDQQPTSSQSGQPEVGNGDNGEIITHV